MGYSYKCLDEAVPTEETKYQYVSPDDHLLPKGHYSWYKYQKLMEDCKKKKSGGDRNMDTWYIHTYHNDFYCMRELVLAVAELMYKDRTLQMIIS